MKLHIDLGLGNFYYLFIASKIMDFIRTIEQTLNRSVYVIKKNERSAENFLKEDH